MSNDAEARARALLAEMTIDEKAQQLTCVEPFSLMNVGMPTTEQLDAQLRGGIGHVAMFSMFQHRSPADHARTVNAIQRYLVEETRLGIPAIFHLEALNGLIAPDTTVFPTAISLASTWNTAGVEEMASISRRQARALGYGQALSPVMDVARDARWGRVHETYGEDPYLASEFSVAFTRGMQGENLTEGVIATGKHFLGFAMTEGGQHMAATVPAGRELREVYARPFEAAIREAGLGSVMNSYSTIDGVPVAASREILDELLRGELGFTGTVVADYGAISSLMNRQNVADSPVEAARLSLIAGLDVEFPSPVAYGPSLAEAVRSGTIPVELLDRSVLRVLRDKFALGLFDSPYVPVDATDLDLVMQDGADLARDLARQSIVLLSNDGTLPLTPVPSIAVVGPHSSNRGVAFPAYTYFGALGLMGAVDTGESVKMAGLEDANSGLPEEARAALRAQLGPHLARGFNAYASEHYGAESLAEALDRLAPGSVVTAVEGCGVLDGELDAIESAVAAAETADVVVLALGGRAGWFGESQTEGEGSDQADIDLPDDQIELARRIVALGRPTVAVVFTGRPFALTTLDELVGTIVYAGYGGQSGVAAVAETLLGQVNPSGKLPVTLPRHSGQIPIHYSQHIGSGYRRTSVDMHAGYNDMSSRPLYPFGHGLSFSSFDYSSMQVDDVIPANGDIRAHVTITNTGDRAGTEIVQFYAAHRAPMVTRPAQQLIAFGRVTLQPGEAGTVSIIVSTGQIAYLGGDGYFVFEPSAVEIQVGASSDDIRSRATVEVHGPAADWSHARPLLPRVEISVDPPSPRIEQA